MATITNGNKRTLAFIINYIVAHGYQPNYREIATGIGASSTNAAKVHLDALVKKGMLPQATARKARAMELGNLQDCHLEAIFGPATHPGPAKNATWIAADGRTIRKQPPLNEYIADDGGERAWQLRTVRDLIAYITLELSGT